MTCFVCGSVVPESEMVVEYLKDWEEPEHICQKPGCLNHIDKERNEKEYGK